MLSLENIMMKQFTPPLLLSDSFNCPHCDSYAHQFWDTLITSAGYAVGDFKTSLCAHCNKYMIWKGGKALYPLFGNTPMPNDDIPDEIKRDYDEARIICKLSPRSACILLRLCIEKICDDKNAEGHNLNDKIIFLCKHNLDPRIIERLDAIRVIGNNAAHPLTMDLKDDVDTAETLFIIINQIAESLYTADKTFAKLDDILHKSKKTSK